MTRTYWLFLGALMLASGPAHPQSAATMAEAQRLLGGSQYQEARTLLQAIVKSEPENGEAWLALGTAERKLGETAKAAAAYRQANSVSRTRGRAMRALFVLYAGAGKPDQAYVWFRKIRERGGADLSALALAPEVANLSSDRRFAILFPAHIRFEPPFVEKTRVIHEWRGEKAGDEFGWIARAVGDVDHDGVQDAVVSAPAHPPQGDGTGTIYLYSGKSGKLLWKHAGHGVDLLGNGLEAAGDVNRDGVPDVIAGAPGVGKAYVLSGRDGSVLFTFTGQEGDEGFGTKASGIGDMNGDGYPDLAVGAPAPAGPGGGKADYPGYVYLFSGKDGSLLWRIAGEAPGAQMGSALGGGHGLLIVGAGGAGPHHAGRVYVYEHLHGAPVYIKDADSTGAALGAMFVSVAGDVNGDGAPDVYASDWANAAKGPYSGRVYVYSGTTGTVLLSLDGQTVGEGFGTCAGKAGDVDGDGRADLVIGSWQYSRAAWSGGRVAVYSGRDGHLIQSFTGRVPGDTLGFDAVGIGDADGDGHVDFLVTSAWSMVNGIRSGRAYIVAGAIAPMPEMHELRKLSQKPSSSHRESDRSLQPHDELESRF